jgi:hypothetical protein
MAKSMMAFSVTSARGKWLNFILERIDVDLWLCGKREKVWYDSFIGGPLQLTDVQMQHQAQRELAEHDRPRTRRGGRSSRAVRPRAALLHFSFSKVVFSLPLWITACSTILPRFQINQINSRGRVAYAPQTRVASQSGRPASIWCFRSSFLNGPNMNMNNMKCRK